MKINNKSKISITVILFLLFGGCTKDFDEMNIDPNSPVQVPASNILLEGLRGSAIQLFQMPLNINYDGTFAGYYVNTRVAGAYLYRGPAINGQFRSMFRNMSILHNVIQVAEREGNQNLYAAGLTMKAYMGQKASDRWGSIPYSEAIRLEDDIVYPEYDSEPELYDQFLAELKYASQMFEVGAGNLGQGDFLFRGDVEKWRKFANSTRLRVAIRMSFVDPKTSSSVISEILNNPAQYPVMIDNSDNAYFWWTPDRPDVEPFFDNFGAAANNIFRLTNTLVSHLLDLNDPRLPVYANKNRDGEFRGYKFGIGQAANPWNSAPLLSEIGDKFFRDPAGFSPFMNCTEIYFIKAEAYERNLVSGNARQAYETGITMSMQENGIEQADIEAYLGQPEVAWDEGSTSNLEKIYLQKWISLFKQSTEAWAEVRRTDVPLLDVSEDYATNHNRPPFRMPFTEEERDLNINYPYHIELLDIFYGTQIWWDTRTGVY